MRCVLRVSNTSLNSEWHVCFVFEQRREERGQWREVCRDERRSVSVIFKRRVSVLRVGRRTLVFEVQYGFSDWGPVEVSTINLIGGAFLRCAFKEGNSGRGRVEGIIGMRHSWCHRVLFAVVSVDRLHKHTAKSAQPQDPYELVRLDEVIVLR